MTRLSYALATSVAAYFVWKTRVPFFIGVFTGLFLWTLVLCVRRAVTHRILRGRGTGGHRY